ncbi:uncharacterized protein L203_101584 [Cryptococcus depauperatus CBS 7841]|uniref:Probable RNA polymerase II nuclear localization protein SLC7A6OS n=1 Tax=Cryptococcus depauperatus CBS 7841 TaxID=1295531 RepID=A0A1E3ITE1_9TREE|nr:hypothetical protein L203_01049 [Cryptococcus depauperatus CBS 7841]
MDLDPFVSSPLPPPSFTVLRIKRKATEPALSSLVIQDEARAKRRRDIAGRPKGVFRLADTVPGTWVGEGEEGEVLKTRIQDLLAIKASPSPKASAPLPEPPKLVSQPSRLDHRIPTTSNASELNLSHDTIAKETRQVSRSQRQPHMQYRVVPPLSPRTRAMLPPRVITAEETENGARPFRFVDAQAVQSGSRNRMIEQEDKEVAAFLPMLEEYLRMEQKDEKKVEGNVEDVEWVYDLYYRDWTDSVSLNIGAGDGVTNGQLLGFEDHSPPSSVSGSVPEDEADEDSNDEDYYRNDYPEDEDADEDMVGFRGGDDSDRWSEDSDERGEWGYR